MRERVSSVRRAWKLGFLMLLACSRLVAEPYSQEKLKELAEPIALYPDVLIAQILPASTNPIHIVDAARYLQKAGGEVEEPPPDHDWHPSVVALLGVPPVLNMMNEQLSWTLELGEAVKNQRAELMDAIQTARREAQAAGKLETNEQQVVVVEKEVIRVQPADPQVIYVPQYYPAYPTTSTTVVYKDNSDEAAFVGLTVGLLMGAAIANADYHYVHWRGHGFYYDNDFYDDFLKDRYAYARDLQQRRFDHVEELQKNRQDFVSDRQDELRDRQSQRQEKVGDRQTERRDSVDSRQTERREASGDRQTQRQDRLAQSDRASRDQAARLERTTRSESRTASRDQRAQRTSESMPSRRQAVQSNTNRRSLGGSGSYSRQSAFGGSNFEGRSASNFSQRGSRSMGGRSFGGRRR